MEKLEIKLQAQRAREYLAKPRNLGLYHWLRSKGFSRDEQELIKNELNGNREEKQPSGETYPYYEEEK